jgi:hypothetical protein
MTDFKIEEMNKTSISLILGQRESGKTNLLCHLINKNKKLDTTKAIYIMTSKPNDITYTDIASDKHKFIFKPKDVEILEEIIMLQKVKYIENILDHIIIIIDDCITFASDITKKQCIQDLFFNNDIYGVTLYLTMQYPFNLRPALRSQIDYLFILQNGPSVISKIQEQYVSHLSSESFNDIYKKLDDKNKVMVSFKNNATWFYLNDTISNHDDTIKLIKYVESDGETNIIFDDIIHYYKDDNNQIVI